MRTGTICLAAGLAALGGCLPDDPPAGLRRTPAGAGPRVVFDLDGRPLPDIPFPNDLATRPDPTSPTGLRLNLSLEAPTAAERAVRALAFGLDGFGTFAPITVRFDAPLDVVALDGRGRPPADDPILIVDLTPGRTFGERIPLDLGRGHFPLVLPDPSAYFDHDPRAGESNLLFETVDEDRDGDGRLDPGEDGDGDGRLDRPNVLRPGGDPTDDLLTFYERETDTLILRPLVPLRPAHRYAVVLTEGVRGVDGEPVRSPFAFVHHTRQTGALARLEEALTPHGVRLDEVAFVWSFTTQSATRTLVDLRRGLAGGGPYAALAERFPAEVSRVELLKDRGAPEPALLRTDELARLFRTVGPFFVAGAPGVLDAFIETYQDVDHLVAGRFVTPYLLVDDDGHVPPSQGGYPADEDEHFRLDPVTGEMVVGSQEVPFWCTIPKERPGRRQPFPVVLFAHGFGGSRLHSLGVAGTLARWGFATCAIDAVGHGQVFAGELGEALEGLLAPQRLGPLKAVMEGTRARDLNNDGLPDPGGDTFTTDPLHTRDVVRQSALDWMQFVRVLRGFDRERRWAQPGGVGERAGDWDGDGTPDLGGPDVAYHFAGISYGALLAGIVGGIEPYLSSVVPISGGGGLSDIGVRSTQPGVPEAVILRAMGPLVLGDPAEAGVTTVRFLVPDVHRVRSLPFAQLPPLVPGDRVVLTNLRSGETSEALVNAAGAFRVAVAADSLDGTALRHRAGIEPWRSDFEPPRLPSTSGYGDPLRLEVYDAAGRLRRRIEQFEEDVVYEGVRYGRGQPLIAVAQGWGLQRQTPEMRRFTQIMQTLLEPADPVNYARHHFAEPLRYGALAPGAPGGANLLVVLTLGDTHVPVATGLTFARAAGILRLDAPSPDGEGTVGEKLVRLGVVEGLARLERQGAVLADPDNLSDGADGHDAVRCDPPLRITGKRPGGGEVGLRMALVEPRGAHGFAWPRPDRPFDIDRYLANLMGQLFATASLEHDPCLATPDCPP